ncbi:MAG: hypothetical protein ABIP75_03195 [Pyrinomonadaceae bacterium]
MDEWPGKATRNRQSSKFGTPWAKTQQELERELKHVGYRIGSVALHTFHSPYDVRQDGGLRSNVRMPSNPGVIVKFTRTDSNKIVAMQFACDRFLQWKDNVLAIGRAMAALRMVDRYGVTSGRGKASQYEGFRQQLPPAINLGGMSVDEAAIYLARFGTHQVPWETIRDNRIVFDVERRTAAMKAHPDKGGSHDDMAKVNLAVEVLRQNFAEQS